jgi:hypothetical protein
MKCYRCPDSKSVFGLAFTPSIIYVRRFGRRYLNFCFLWWDFALEWEVKNETR